jgi:Tfp pilus assembly protein PilN
VRAVNLLPREDPKRQGKRFTIGVQLALVSPVVVLALLGAGYLLASAKVHDDKATLQALQDELATLPQPAAVPQTNGDLALQRSQRIDALSAALAGRVAWDRVLREISTVLPEDVWLTTIKAESPAPTPPPPPAPTTTTTTTTSSETTTTTLAPAAPPTSPLSLEGYTYSQEGVARLLTRLAVIPELQDVKLIQSSQTPIAGQIVVSFSIQADVRKQSAA